MPGQTDKTSAGPSGNPVLPLVLIMGAVLFVVMGTVLPGVLDLPSPLGLIFSIVFYAVAAGDVAIALWLRSRMKKAAGASSSGGTVQRQ